MKAVVFKTRGQWFLGKVTENEPEPEQFKKNNSSETDWAAYDLAFKNYHQIELATVKRHALRINNDWLLNDKLKGLPEGELIHVEIDFHIIVRKLAKYEPNQQPLKPKGKGVRMK